MVEMPLMKVTHPSLLSDPFAARNPTRNAEEKGDLCFFGRDRFDLLMLHNFQQIKAWSTSSKSVPVFMSPSSLPQKTAERA